VQHELADALLLNNTVGAALWAADIEAKGNKMTESTAPSLREATKKTD
jgi:hypothetical protein